MADMPYVVLWSPKALNSVKTYLRTPHNGDGATNRSKVIRAIDARLRLDPVEFGEIYRLRGAVEEHHAVMDGVSIDFAVDKKKRFVHVRACSILSGPGS